MLRLPGCLRSPPRLRFTFGLYVYIALFGWLPRCALYRLHAHTAVAVWLRAVVPVDACVLGCYLHTRFTVSSTTHRPAVGSPAGYPLRDCVQLPPVTFFTHYAHTFSSTPRLRFCWFTVDYTVGYSTGSPGSLVTFTVTLFSTRVWLFGYVPVTVATAVYLVVYTLHTRTRTWFPYVPVLAVFARALVVYFCGSLRYAHIRRSLHNTHVAVYAVATHSARGLHTPCSFAARFARLRCCV